jgi:predicted GNAT superfamily acetyltransferase
VAGSKAAGSETQIAPIRIRQLFHLSEFEDVLQLQKTIWSFDDIELLPLRFLVVVSKIGGHVFGAYDGARMIGFCFAIPGIKPDGSPYLHSHMLGVMPEYRNAQVGQRLKLRQRDDALARGITLMEWTFDPLELKNANLNIEKLGAIVRRYSPNQYGTTSSPLHGGLPTDRCVAEWWLDSPRVRAVLDGGPAVPRTAARERISYPADIARIREKDNDRARAIQQANAEKFLDAFSRGLAVTGFERSDTEGTYLLEPWQK